MTHTAKLLPMIVLFLAGTLFGSTAFAQVDLCPLMPGNPAEAVMNRGVCFGRYWPRNQSPKLRDLGDFGAIIMLSQYPSADAAQAAVTSGKAPVPNALGDAGGQWMEDPTQGDLGPPNEFEIKAGERYFMSEQMLAFRGYKTWFSCGAYVVSGTSNPSKAIAFRELLAELEQNLSKTGACAAKGAVLANAPPPTTTTDENPGWRHFEGEEARKILEANKAGINHLVVLSRTWDAKRNCWVEERAWAGGIRGSDGVGVTVGLGSKRAVCVTGKTVPIDRVNDAQRAIKEAEDNLATALARHAQLERYMKDGRAAAWAADRDKEVLRFIEYYKDLIRVNKAALVDSVPQ